MTALHKKLLRDLWRMKMQALAIALVVAAGVAILVTTRATLDSLTLSRDAYYDDYRFAHVFATARRAPLSLVDRIEKISGVLAVEARVVVEVTVSVPNVPEPATGRIVSIPERRRPMLNDIYLREGRYIEPGRDNEVLVGETFALAHGLHPGDAVRAVLNGRQKDLLIVGVALSPEYVYQISGSSPWPDDRRFGIFWMGATALRSAMDMGGAFNDVAVSLARGASEGDVIAALDQLLSPYGTFGAHGRSRQTSDSFLREEFAQLKTMAVFVPTLFMAVAAFLLQIVVTRLVSTERTQIATLKAFGYSNTAVGIHYLELALSIVVFGSLLGVGVGFWLGDGMTRLYADYYRFPVLKLVMRADTAAIGVVTSLLTGTLGVLTAVRSAAKLPPAEAMRPEAPAVFRRSLWERLGLHRLLTPAGRMIARNLARRPGRAAASALGVAFAVSILVVGLFSEDAMDHVIRLEFHLSQGEDAAVYFQNPVPRAALVDLRHLPGVSAAEPLRMVPVVLRAQHREHHGAVLGLSHDGHLHKLVDRNGAVVQVPASGLVLGKYLADKLGLLPGDPVELERLDGNRARQTAIVAATVDDIAGANATMDLDALNRMFGESDAISGAYLAVDSDMEPQLQERIKTLPRVAGATFKRSVLDSFERIMERNLGPIRAIEVIFSGIIAFAVVYNKARIALAERSRELASLRVLGFTRGEVSRILLGELAVTTVLGIPIGALLGVFFSWAMCKAYESTELFRFPLVIEPSTYAYAALVVLSAAAVSALSVRRQVDHLDLVGVLKTRD